MSSLEERLARLEAERDILRLAARYCHGADDLEVAAFLEVWVPDAVWNVGAHRFRGTVEIEEAVRRQWAATTAMFHGTSDSLIDVGVDEARGRHDVVSLAVLADGRRLLTTGRYEDVCARTSVGWRIQERRAIVVTSVEIPS